MNSPNSKQQLFDRWAPFYDFWIPSILYQATHQRLLEYVELPEDPNVLDLSCGTGRLLNRLAAAYPSLQGTGLDFSAAMLRQARRSNRHRPRLIFVQGQAAPLRFTDRQFDAIFNTFSFLHYPEPQQVLAEICRVLRPDGTFYWVDPTTNASTGVGYSPVTPNGMRVYSPEVRQQMGTQAGMKHIRHEYLIGKNLLSMFVKVS
ncbi:methyltransferase type 11 [Leptolyngbya sp. Heron Island J]|uniref:class I SAM-dependent methyltransferase n=1 Tax=Leptolyngbya sp. Heron Island J TaxID=1385935 RepID=UPI0003B971C2|nr:class I SAM-dependent methyltransferase [Leptolyngbya sp. Heron Island J]ESA38691.1 methyltransferase type 11 [Leptolyngbya sp. Heron Island J]